jgi:hypothetical protein
MNKEELIDLVRKIIEVDGTEEEIDAYTDSVSKEVLVMTRFPGHLG